MSKWSDATPPVGEVVEVWHPGYGCIDAIWTGRRWQTVDGLPLLEVTHWRYR